MTQPTPDLPLERPPQFALRTLFIGVALCGALFALMRIVGPFFSVGLLMFFSLVALHVAGNALGTTLTNRRREISIAVEEEPADLEPPVCDPLGFYEPPSPGRLGERTPVGWFTITLTAGGAALGGALGVLGYYYLMRVTPAGIAVGGVSSAVLGGFFGFLVASFLANLVPAWRQSLRESQGRST